MVKHSPLYCPPSWWHPPPGGRHAAIHNAHLQRAPPAGCPFHIPGAETMLPPPQGDDDPLIRISLSGRAISNNVARCPFREVHRSLPLLRLRGGAVTASSSTTLTSRMLMPS